MPRKAEPYHEVMGLIELRRKNFKKAVAEYRQADLTQLHNKYQLAEALEGAGQADEALKLFKEVSVNNFNTVDFALLRSCGAQESRLRSRVSPETAAE